MKWYSVEIEDREYFVQATDKTTARLKAASLLHQETGIIIGVTMDYPPIKAHNHDPRPSSVVAGSALVLPG